MGFKIEESTGPYFTNGPASFRIVNSTEDIANNRRRSIYLKFELEITDKDGKSGTLKDCIFSNQADKYNTFLKSINRQELSKDSLPASVFNGQSGKCVLGVNEKGYSCIDDYVASNESPIDSSLGWDKFSKESKTLEEEVDDIPF